MSRPLSITGIVPFFTNKGQAQVNSFTNAATLITRDSRTYLMVRADYELGKDSAGRPLAAPEEVGQYIGIIRLNDKVDICWHNAEILVDSAADKFVCQLGLLSDAGVFVPKATMGAAVGSVSSPVVPGPNETPLDQPMWVVARILDGGTPNVPVSGSVSFYIPYITLA